MRCSNLAIWLADGCESRYLDHDGEVSGDGRVNPEDEGHDGEGHRPAALTRHTCQRRTGVYRQSY